MSAPMNELRPESEMKHCDVNQQKREEIYDRDFVVDVATYPLWRNVGNKPYTNMLWTTWSVRLTSSASYLKNN